MSDQILRLARLGVWALPIYAATLFAGTVTHQPPPQTQLADWSRYVTTNEFLIGHIVFSIFGSIFGIAAFAQPAIGRLYLSGQTQTARDVYYDAAQGTPMVVVALVFIVLLVASFIVFGVAFARLELMPRWAGIGYAVSGPLFAVIGFALDNWIQSVAAILMTASAVWMVIALRRFEYRRTSQG